MPAAYRRRRFTAAQREDALAAAGGLCHLCGLPIDPGRRWDMSHVDIPHELGGDAVAPAHLRCHQIETAQATAPLVAKTRRQRQRHIGAIEARGALPGGRRSRWKRKLGGGMEIRIAGVAREQALREARPGLDWSAPPIGLRIARRRD
jgi:hypothetical protein